MENPHVGCSDVDQPYTYSDTHNESFKSPMRCSLYSSASTVKAFPIVERQISRTLAQEKESIMAVLCFQALSDRVPFINCNFRAY